LEFEICTPDGADLQSVPCTKSSFNFPIFRPSGTLYDSGTKCYKYLALSGLLMWVVFFNPGVENPVYQYFAPLGLSIGIYFLEFGAWNLVLENWNLHYCWRGFAIRAVYKLIFLN
jgi:hypothetical protein